MRSTDRFLAGLVALFAGALLIGLALVAVAPFIIGWTPHVVVSGSMQPTVRRGDVVVAQWTDGLGLHKGQLILFESERGLTAHRIVEVLPDGTYRTRGDANPAADSTPVRPRDVEGIARVVVPFIGRLALLPGSPIATQLLTIALLALIAWGARFVREPLQWVVA